MLNSTTVSSLVFLFMAVGAWCMTSDLTEMGSFFPRVIAVIMGVFCVIQVILSAVQKKKERPFSGINPINLFTMVAGIIIYMAMLAYIGFILSGILFMTFFFWFFSPDRKNGKTIPKYLILATALCMAFYAVFHHIFLVPLPLGVLFGG